MDTHLKQSGIDTSKFEFYDQNAFLACEQKAPSFLEQYAKWVAMRPRDQAYDQHVRDVVPRLSELLAAALKADGFEGGCVAASSMLTRMLDRLEVWSFGIQGAMTLEVAGRSLWRGFHTIDDLDFPGGVVGHAWVVAPPYAIVDVAIALQRWAGDPMGEYVPPYLLVEANAKTIEPTATDVVSAQIRARYAIKDGGIDSELHHRLEPRLRSFGRSFPALETEMGELRLRYVPVAIRQSDVPLELINTEGKVGRPAIKIWQDDIAPAFGR